MSGLALINSGASKTLLQSVEQLLAALSIPTTSASVAKENALVVGSVAPEGVLAAVVQPLKASHPAYENLKTTIVRAVLPRRAPGMVQLRDALDVYHNSGIDTSEEVKQASEAFHKATQIAIQEAKKLQADHISLVVKPVSKFHRLNDLFIKTASAAASEAGLNTDVLNTARAANELLLFPEKYEVVLTNDDPVCENVQLAFAGAVGGVPSRYHMVQGGLLSGGHSLKSVAWAAVQELRAMGLQDEAMRVEQSIQSDL